jgi:hypothetical protein
VDLRAILDDSLHLFYIVLVNPFWICEVFGDIDRNDNFIDSTVGIGRYYSSACKVNSLGGEIETETALLSFQTGTERADGFVSKQVKGDTWCITVEILSHIVCHQKPLFHKFFRRAALLKR